MITEMQMIVLRDWEAKAAKYMASARERYPLEGSAAMLDDALCGEVLYRLIQIMRAGGSVREAKQQAKEYARQIVDNWNSDYPENALKRSTGAADEVISGAAEQLKGLFI